MTNRELRTAIRSVYAWPGGYEMFGITTDGATLCCECMRKEYRQIAWSRAYEVNDGWRVWIIDATCNTDSEVTCDHCNRTIQEDWKA